MSKSCHVSIVLRCGDELLATNYLVRQGACLELLCELCATGGYSQVESSGVGEAVSGYILYICLGSELWAEAINCCWAVAVGGGY